MSKIWRAEQVGYYRARVIDMANRRRKKGVSKEEFRRAMMRLMVGRKDHE